MFGAMILSPAFQRAFADAEYYHHDQLRKGTEVPYFSHLLGVSGLVLEAGGTETEAIAALLHDAPEHAGGAPVLAAIEQNFGSAVAAIVRACSDALPSKGEDKPEWRDRKRAYLSHLRAADASTLLVSAADKLHNLRAIQSDYRDLGNAVFERFSAPTNKRSSVLGYYHALHDVYVDERSPQDPRRHRLSIAIGDILDWFEETSATAETPRVSTNDQRSLIPD
jgi:(p)ppGpp synthase/HD superfamily hydrolase